MKKIKKTLACLLAMSMILTMLPSVALAADTTEETQTAVIAEENETQTEAETSLETDTEAEEDAAVISEIEEEEEAQVLNEDEPEEAEEVALPESDHNYGNYEDTTWEYTVEDATNGVAVTFDEQTKVESGYDYIYIYDADDNEIGVYTDTELAGVSIYVPTSTFKIRLTSDKNGTYYGFKVTSAVAMGETIDLSMVGTVDDISPVYQNEDPEVVVRVNGTALTAEEDYTVAYDTSAVGITTATITGTGKYSGELTADFKVVDDDNLAEGATVKSANTLLRQAGEESTTSIQFENVTSAWASAIQSVTLTPVESDGELTEIDGVDEVKEVTLEKSDITVSGNYIKFKRTEENPVVYVAEGHDPITITGRWSTNVYPQSQIYKVTVKARGYKDTVGTTTYYTGTACDFSIIIDTDGDSSTTDDQEIVKTWTSDELDEMATFANGSSQCGMTGFRTFSGTGVSLSDLLSDAGVEVSDSDYFLLDTSDHYGNNFTYDELFNTTRYFLSGIYEDGFADYYNELVSNDDEAGSTIALRRYLAEKCLENDSTIEPRINTNYVETIIAGSSLAGIVEPTEENTEYNELVSYENRYRFFYGISLVQEDCTVTFDTQGGSEVADQTVLSHLMTSTSNTTIKSSYWANSLVIYRGAGEKYKTTASTAATTITKPEDPTRSGYEFGGWYTDAECTEGNEFDFEANDGTVDQNTTLYAKWIPDINVTDFKITNAEHNDADGELNQTIIATLTFDRDIALTSNTLKDDLLITIAGGDVNDTARHITYEVKDGNQLVIKMVSTGWAAIYNGTMKITASENGISNIVAADGTGGKVVLGDVEGRIPIGIVVSNDAISGTASTPASTEATVTHKANMRGMYSFQLVSIVDGEETVIGQSTSHAHNFYTSINEAAIAQAMASAINGYEGYSTSYEEGDTSFVVTADEAVAGQTLAVKMVELDAAVTYGHAGTELVIENIKKQTCATAGSFDVVTYCTFCNDEISRKPVKIAATGEHTYADKVTKATTKAAGKVESVCSVCGDVESTTAIAKIGTVTLSASTYTYNGSAKKPTVTVKDSDGNTIASKYYTVKYSNNTNPGKATVTVTFKTNYSGTVTKTFTINPKSTTLSSVTSKTKGFVAKWKAQTTQMTGYEVQYSTSSKFTKATTTSKVVSKSNTSLTVSSLTAKKTYYVRVRTYKTVNGTKYYSSWSTVKKVTTK
jgi:uncharacterized repeat protein (TIGR02543 family)